MAALLDLVVRCKHAASNGSTSADDSGGPIKPSDILAGPVTGCSEGQRSLIMQIHGFLDHCVNQRPIVPQIVPASATPVSLDVPERWTLDTAKSFRSTSWNAGSPLTGGLSEVQFGFVSSLLDATVGFLSRQSSSQTELPDAAQIAALPTPHKVWKRYENLEGLCAFMLHCTVQNHRPGVAHVSPEHWTPKQAVAFRDRIWPVFKQNRDGMSDAQIALVSSLLDVITGTPPPPPAAGDDVSRNGNLPRSTEASDERPRDEFDLLAAAMANARARHEATAEENGKLTAQIAALTRDAHDAGNEIAALKAQISDVERQLRDDKAKSQSAMVRLEAHAQQAEDRADQLQLALATSQQAAAADKKRVADANEEQSARHQRELCEARTELLRLKHHASPAGSVSDVAPGTAAIALLIRAARSALQLRPGGRPHTPFNYYDAPAIPNPCALLVGNENGPSKSCLALARFRNGLVTALGLDCVSQLAHGADNDRIIIAFHGTPSAESILCQGFDTSERSGQNYGPGEYFARDWDTAEQYATNHGTRAGETPGVIVAVLVAAKARAVNGGNWFVVDNPAAATTVSYCLPLLFVPVRQGATLQQCTRCRPKGASTNPSAPIPAAVIFTAVEFKDDSDTWTPMASSASATVLAARAAGGVTHNVLTANGFTYHFDWQRMVQINTHTGRERSIRFV